MNVSELGEFGLIARLRARLGDAAASSRLVAGIGDDAAAWRPGAGLALATTDTMVAGVHFLPGRAPYEDVGWKALAVNISDIAAMGGTPAFALVTLCVPPEMVVADADALYDGLAACAREYGVTVAGGDIVSAPVLTITVALFGESAADDRGAPLLLRRDAARAGDAIAVTGPLGGSAAGLRVLLEHDPVPEELRPLVERHMRPRPRIDSGPAAVRAGVRCAIDISDGLVQDLGHICAASGCGAEIEVARLPVDAEATVAYGDDACGLALTGGEDYELLLIAPRDALDRTAIQLHVIGEIVEGEPRVRVLGEDGAEVTPEQGGWDHLRARR